MCFADTSKLACEARGTSLLCVVTLPYAKEPTLFSLLNDRQSLHFMSVMAAVCVFVLGITYDRYGGGCSSGGDQTIVMTRVNVRWQGIKKNIQ